MRISWRITLFFILIATSSLCSAGPIDYYVNQTIGAGGVTGYIETDGTIGVLGATNIVGWNLQLNDGASTYNLPGGVFFPFTGSDLSATASQLLFNFSGTDGGSVAILNQSFDLGVCFASANTGCFTFGGAGEAIHIVCLCNETSQFSSLSGAQAIASMTLLPLQGGALTAPILLPSGQPVAGMVGTIGTYGDQEYYSFWWAGGTFSATASISGTPNTGASYLFSMGTAGSCGSAGSATLSGNDSFTGTIGIGNLATGQYCIGLDANNPNDPTFAVTFNTPVQGSVPEPSTFVLLAGGLGIIGASRLTKLGAASLVKRHYDSEPDAFSRQSDAVIRSEVYSGS